MDNIEQTIISQYGTSPVIRELLDRFNSSVGPEADIDALYANVWNIETAKGNGLDIWGRIVDVQRNIPIYSVEDTFGFGEAYPDFTGFDQAPFATENGKFYYRLDDEPFRLLILAKALANISGTSIPEINSFLRLMFGPRSYVQGYIPYSYSFGFARPDFSGFDDAPFMPDVDVYELVYIFEKKLTPVESAILQQTDVIPHPAGISYRVEQHI